MRGGGIGLLTPPRPPPPPLLHTFSLQIHGGLLGVRGNASHEADMAAHGIAPIDLVVVNLYAFDATVSKGADFATCIENIDIGGPSMLRSAAKNHAAVAVASSPSQYEGILGAMGANGGGTPRALRRALAAAAFSTTAGYDASISSWFASVAGSGAESTAVRSYSRDTTLKYGCNPHQSPAWVGHLTGGRAPFTVLNGTPGYINFLDAANAWQLVRELRAATGLPAAASFKHVSPAGAAVAVPLSAAELALLDVDDASKLTPTAIAYLRARDADPMCSYGDFSAVSEVVDVATALILKREVSDGIVAPGYEPEALAILREKKKGDFIILVAAPDYAAPPVEFREVYGMVMAQRRNDVELSAATVGNTIVSARTDLSAASARDLTVALVTIKYTQSNSVGYALGGQMIGVGAGQQSRVDCVKLAGRKVNTWWLRRHPKVLALPFKADVGRTARTNARVRYIEGDMTEVEAAEWALNFESTPAPLTAEEKAAWNATLTDVSLASDAFFPFRDSLDHAAKFGVKFVAQPGGSVQDAAVTKAADDYGMVMGASRRRGGRHSYLDREGGPASTHQHHTLTQESHPPPPPRTAHKLPRLFHH